MPPSWIAGCFGGKPTREDAELPESLPGPDSILPHCKSTQQSPCEGFTVYRTSSIAPADAPSSATSSATTTAERSTPSFPGPSGTLTAVVTAMPFQSLKDASHVNDALLRVSALIQKFVELRPGSASLKALHHALRLITDEWHGAFARIHIISKNNALLLAGAPPRLADVARPFGYPMDSEPKLMSLHRPGLAMAAAQASPSGCFSWVQPDPGARQDTTQPPVPPDYAPFVSAGACAVFTSVVKLSGDSSAVLTCGFADCSAGASDVLRDLWPNYLKVVAVGMATLFVSPSLPQYLTLAVELNDALDLDSAMLSVVRQLRRLAGQTATRQLWFRIALTARQNSRTAILFDVPSEGLHLPRISHNSGRSSNSFPLSPLSGGSGGGVGRVGRSSSFAPTTARLFRVKSTPTGNELLHPACDNSGEGGSGVLRTAVAIEHSLLFHVLENRKQAMVPNVQKLLNHGGGVATDIFAVGHMRPPAAVLLLPLLQPYVRASANGTPGHYEGCYGAVYCMSSVATDFADVQAQLVETVVEVLSPHFHSALCREPLATDYEVMFTNLAPTVNSAGQLQGSRTISGGPRVARGHSEQGQVNSPGALRLLHQPSHLADIHFGSLTTNTPTPVHTAAPTSHNSLHPSPTGRGGNTNGHGAHATAAGRRISNGHIAAAAAAAGAHHHQQAAVADGEHSDSAFEPVNGLLKTPTLSSTLSGASGSATAVPASCTNALVTGLTEKINTHRLIHNLDLGSPISSLADMHLLGLLGCGGYGYVFRGKWRGMLAAIKLLKCSLSVDDANKEVLKHAHEIAILSSVSHPNIIQAYTFITDVSVSDVLDECLTYLDPALHDDPAYLGLLALRASTCHIEVLELCDKGCLFDLMSPDRHMRKPPASPPPPPPPASPLSPSPTAGTAAAAAADASQLQHQQGVVPESPTPTGRSERRSHGSRDKAHGVGSSGSSNGGLVVSLRHDLPALLLCLVELASALGHLHSLGIVHCDLKPDNVLLRSSTNDARGFTVKLADFGLSRVQDDDGGMEFPCNSCGTMAYVAPEALAAKNKVDHAIDIYSFGILMYELYTSQRPYAKLRPPNFIHGVTVLGIRPQFPRGAHAGYVSLARVCWDPQPSRRPVFDHIVTALNAMLTEVTGCVC